MIRAVPQIRLIQGFWESCRVWRVKCIRTEYFFFGIATISKSANEYFAKALEDHIPEIKKHFLLIFLSIFSKSVLGLDKMFQFKNCGIIYWLPLPFLLGPGLLHFIKRDSSRCNSNLLFSFKRIVKSSKLVSWLFNRMCLAIVNLLRFLTCFPVKIS